jgi:2-oxoglutarate dehydrogenase E2 component (dihydrolipoamide succinyltransferase)
VIELKVPAVGESVREVQIGQWRKAVGDRVARDEELVQLETDKATVDLPAPEAGVLTKILKQAGESVAVGDVIAHLENDGKSPKADREKETDAPNPAADAPKIDTPKPDSPKSDASNTDVPFPSPMRRRKIASRGWFHRHAAPCTNMACGPRMSGPEGVAGGLPKATSSNTFNRMG